MVDVVCSDPKHHLRSAELDWAAVLGQADKPQRGFLCPACDRLRKVEAVIDNSNPINRLTIAFDGRASVEVVKTYPDTGDIVGREYREGLVQNVLTEGEVSALIALREKIKTALFGE